MLSLIALLSIVVSPALASQWVVLCIGKRLRQAVDPTRRADLATTPIIPAEYLKSQLARPITWATLPCVVAVMGLFFGVGLGIMSAAESGGRGWEALLPIIAVVGLFLPAALSTLVAEASLLHSAERACAAGKELNVAAAGAAAGSWAMGSVFLTLFLQFLGFAVFSYPGSSGSGGSSPGLVVIACAFIAVGSALMVLWENWRSLVQSYLVLEAGE